MKKLFILIAFLMLSGAVMAEPQMKDLQALTATKPYVQPPMFSNHNSILENLFLNQKGDRFLADGEEVYTNGIATGQWDEMGPYASTYIAYDPISQYLFGISTGSYNANSDANDGQDSIRKRGEIIYGKYVKGRKLSLAMQFLYDTIDVNDPVYEIAADRIAPPINIDHWSEPTIVVANPDKSTDVSKLKLALSTRMFRVPRNTVTVSNLYNTIWMTNGDKLVSTQPDATFRTGVSYENLDQPTAPYNPGGYNFNRPLKGTVAYIDGIPYTFFFGTILNDAAITTNPVAFGIVAASMENIPAVGQRNLDENLKTIQILDPDVLSVFANLNPVDASWGIFRGINLDSDTNGNIYVALLESIKANADDEMKGQYHRDMKMPAVIKTKYNTNTTIEQDMFADGYTVDVMPFPVLKKYIEEVRGGVFDSTNDAVCPAFSYIRSSLNGNTHNNNNPDLPFVVTSDGSAHFLLPLWYHYTFTPPAGTSSGRVDFVEAICSNGEWTIKPVADIEQIWSAGMSIASIFGNFYHDVETNQLRYWNGYGPYSGMHTGLDPQISRTADGNYLVAKWQMADTLAYVKLTNTVTYIAGADIEVTTDTMSVPSLYLSYRHVHPDSNWSTPIRASHLNYPEKAEDFDPLRDTISFIGTVMPRVIPSINEVIVSYTWALDQSNTNQAQAKFNDKIAKHRTNSYRYSGIIVPSAVTGPGYVGIEEGEPATTDHLSPVYPNPADNTVNFSFSLLKPAYTRLTISNSLGQEVAVVVDQFCNASQYNWNDYNVSNLPAGIYYFTLTSGDVRQTKIFTIAR